MSDRKPRIRQQERALRDWWLAFIGERGYPPTLQEAAERFEVSAVTIHNRLRRLRAAGLDVPRGVSGRAAREAWRGVDPRIVELRDWWLAYIGEHGYPPTIGETAEHFSVSAGTIFGRLRRLRAAGQDVPRGGSGARRRPGKHRAGPSAEAIRRWWLAYIDKHGQPPTLQEAADAFDIAASAVFNKLRALRDIGRDVPRRRRGGRSPSAVRADDVLAWWREQVARGNLPRLRDAGEVFNLTGERVRQILVDARKRGQRVPVASDFRTGPRRLARWWAAASADGDIPTQGEAAEAFGVSGRAVANWLQELRDAGVELPVRGSGERRGNPGLEEQIAGWWRGYCEAGRVPTYGEAAEAFGLSRDGVREIIQRLKARGVDLPTQHGGKQPKRRYEIARWWQARVSEGRIPTQVEAAEAFGITPTAVRHHLNKLDEEGFRLPRRSPA